MNKNAIMAKNSGGGVLLKADFHPPLLAKKMLVSL